MLPTALSFGLPPWLVAWLAAAPRAFGPASARMEAAVDLARRNVAEGTGGPFGAAVFELRSGRLVAAGVNLVTRERCSVLHAEIVALMGAQRAAGSYDLGAEGLPEHQLVSSVEPCAMCLGAVAWSGVSELLCGASGEDASRIGFDEGEKPPLWAAGLERRGVRVVRGVLRAEAAGVLAAYAAAGGEIYNPRRPAAGAASCAGRHFRRPEPGA